MNVDLNALSRGIESALLDSRVRELEMRREKVGSKIGTVSHLDSMHRRDCIAGFDFRIAQLRQMQDRLWARHA